MFNQNDVKIGIVGLGYVGLPLAVAFGEKFDTRGFDINSQRVEELKNNIDSTLECTSEELCGAAHLTYTDDKSDLLDCNVYIVTVPTPIDKKQQPDLSPLLKASEMLGSILSPGDVVIYESTVYPGATEEDCVPVLEKSSNLIFNKDFFIGYSPERINPGDKNHNVKTIKKVTSGSNQDTAKFVDDLYKSVIIAGTHLAPSIKVAEASKIIENVQRDVNIALINELSLIFKKMNINTIDVIEAASTKWNFMKLTPGLVGGHCIGVDPYYLLHKSKQCGYIPDLMRTAREINDGMPEVISEQFIKELIINEVNPVGARVIVLGFTFKENCPDLRNTKVYNLYLSLINNGFEVDVFDPWADPKEVFEEYGINLINSIDSQYDASILAVGHDSVLSTLTCNKEKLGYLMNFRGFDV
ncbi:nucleotide sugar dehydrogenase [Vibrio vulnificus]|uniref:nucleotide sugar dehydrogenase n=1 Tax=Vibrio vulnificus TaxID=672 RepID=UPI00186581EA|nr:nucleotide sugar dehydrogenase [Vibrio vulnificus]EGR7943726.1 nucleotide sugar dehydrogenase [Vibrio vulnificus]EHU9452654.1 nucleotide sugar dehydrogenase [Vibrio vulnificus]EHY0956594.1 nucleotide sugar dehydrogenase [Vibrio vulnificus]EIU7747084.1 nucleotide sugar dehydrogenase [Vibrio vulnificus]EJN6716214.1 nucleotide sugar dehydrogenase [Vibrio vulnificus]